MKIFLKVIHYKLSIIVLIMLPAVVFTLITSKSNIIAGIQSFVVLSGSMEPTISRGSLIFTQKQPSYETNDIIAFKKDKVIVTHRLIKKQKDGTQFLTKGEANNDVDTEPVESQAVLGKSIFVIPQVGYFIGYLRTIQGLILFIIFPTTVFIVFELWHMKKEIEREIEKKLLKKMNSVL